MPHPKRQQAPKTAATHILGVPEPLQRDMPPPQPYPLAALGVTLGPMARTLHAAIQAPQAICGQAVLAAGALAVQAHANVVVDGRTMPLSLYCLTLADSGERKSTVDMEVLRPHAAVEYVARQKWEERKLQHRNDLELYEQTRDAIVRDRKMPQPERALKLQNLGAAPVAPREPMMRCDEPTYEGLVKFYERGQSSVGLFSNEGGRFIGGYMMNKDNLVKTSAGFSQLWSGEPITRVRSGDVSGVLYGRRFSLHLMVQPRIAQLLLGNELVQDQGLLSRMLICAPESTMGTRWHKDIDLRRDPNIILYQARMREVLEAPLPYENEERGELKPRELPLSAAAKRQWVAFYNEVEGDLSQGGAYESIRSFANKVPENTLRIAGVLTLLDNLEAGEIPKHFLEAGIDMGRFYLGESLRLFCDSTIGREIKESTALLQWLQTSRINRIYPSLIYNRGPRSFRTREKALSVITSLEEHGHLFRLASGTEVDGKPRKDVWEVVAGPP